MAIRAVFDANVLISGLIFRGMPGRCLDAVTSKQVECFTCPAILSEVADKLAGKFHLRDTLLADDLAWCIASMQIVEPSGAIHSICRDPDDDVIIECAILSHADFIVTGDADLLDLTTYQSIRIVTPAVFVNDTLSSHHDV